MPGAVHRKEKKVARGRGGGSDSGGKKIASKGGGVWLRKVYSPGGQGKELTEKTIDFPKRGKIRGEEHGATCEE